jgi:hypothetical protein
MLDTPLFRGAGNAFEPMHRVLAEFLAGKTLADAVEGSGGRAALPLSRAVAMITGADGRPPTEFRGLYAWFAACLAEAGDAAGAQRLIESDAVTVLAYGDAAAFQTRQRRAILANIDRDDPYFRSSETGTTAYGGLAGEDLADDFRAILTAPPDSQKFLTVIDVLTIGPPVHSLRSLLREIAIDGTRPAWHRWRAADAWLNGVSDQQASRLELLDELEKETASTGREVLRVHLAGGLPVRVLGVERVRSVLSDFEAAPDDNTIGHLFTFETRLSDEPLPELFAEPTDSWRAPEGERRRSTELEHMLDRLLAEYINVCAPNSSEIWQWTRSVGGDEYLGEQTRKAVASWLDASSQREIEIFDLILDQYQADALPWLPVIDFFRFSGRRASQAVIHHLFQRVARTASAAERNWFERVAVHLVNGADPSAYWLVYDYLSNMRNTKRLQRELTVVPLGKDRLRYRRNLIRKRQAKEKRRQKDIDVLTTQLAALREGKNQNLVWAADRYFRHSSNDDPPSIHRLETELPPAIVDAIRDGWIRLATQPITHLDVSTLGSASGENKSYRIERAVIAGIDVLLDEQHIPTLETAPLVSAIIALKSGFAVGPEDRRNIIYDWAARRLDADAAAGAAALEVFWNAALDAGGTEIEGLWHLTQQGRETRAFTIALEAILGERPAMHENALKTGLIAAFAAIEADRLGKLAKAALGNDAVNGRKKLLWRFVQFALDPITWRDTFLTDFRDTSVEDVAFLDWGGSMGRAVQDFDYPLVRWEAIARVAGARSEPDDRFGSGVVTAAHDLANATYGAITSLSMSAEAQAGLLLQGLATVTSLRAWHQNITHSIAEQARLRRDAEFQHPTALQVAEALAGGPPVNASDLRAIAVEELKRLRDELRTIDTGDWKMFWNRDGDIPRMPLHENECRDYVLSRLRDRMSKYRIAAAQPEAQRADETRADMLILSGAGRNLPVEVKRHYHADVWTAAATQLQGYASAPGADGIGIYLVIWFGKDVQTTPPRPDRGPRPATAAEMESMLITDLPEGMRERTDVIVFDVSRTDAVVKRALTAMNKANPPR